MKAICIVVGGAILFPGCGAPECGEVLGSYEVSFSERSGGTCGPIPTTVAIYDAEGVVMAGEDTSDCEREGVDDGDLCTVDVSLVCNYPDGSTTRFTGVSRQVDGPDRIEGLLTISDAWDTGSCLSTYEVTYDRL